MVFRGLSDAAELVESVFGRFGIPVAIGERPLLARAPIVAALAAWLRLDVEGWRFRQVLSLLTHNYFRPQWSAWDGGRAGGAAERVVRQLQIAAGRDELLANLVSFATRSAERARWSRPTKPMLRGSPRWRTTGRWPRP